MTKSLFLLQVNLRETLGSIDIGAQLRKHFASVLPGLPALPALPTTTSQAAAAAAAAAQYSWINSSAMAAAAAMASAGAAPLPGKRSRRSPSVAGQPAPPPEGVEMQVMTATVEQGQDLSVAGPSSRPQLEPLEAGAAPVAPKPAEGAKPASGRKRRADGKPVVECEVCFKELADPSSLYRHRKIHSGEKPHKCPFCDRRFIQR